jgi:hypothetical protein
MTTPGADGWGNVEIRTTPTAITANVKVSNPAVDGGLLDFPDRRCRHRFIRDKKRVILFTC